MKKCRKCGIEKELICFVRDKSRKDGFGSICKECHTKEARLYRKNNPEKVHESVKRSKGKQPAKYKEWHKAYYERNKARIIANVEVWRNENHDKVLEYAKTSRDNRTDFVNNLKTPCAKCGESRLWVIDFHHIDPNTKLFNIATEKSRKPEDVLREVEKCVCLCRNCHAEFHYKYGVNPLNPMEALNEYLEVN